MTNLMKRRVICELTGWTPKEIENMWERGLMDNFGEVVGKQVQYTPRDLVALAVAKTLKRSQPSLDIPAILAFAWTEAAHIIAHLQKKQAPRFVALLTDTVYVGGGSWMDSTEVKYGECLTDFERMKFVRMEVFNLEKLAHGLSLTIREHIPGIPV